MSNSKLILTGGLSISFLAVTNHLLRMLKALAILPCSQTDKIHDKIVSVGKIFQRVPIRHLEYLPKNRKVLIFD